MQLVRTWLQCRFETVKCDQVWRHRSVPQSSAEGGSSATAAQDWDVDEIGRNIALQHVASYCILMIFDVFCPICGLRNAEKTFEVCGQIQRCGSRCQSVLFAFFCSFFCWFVFLVYSCYALEPLATMSMCHHVPRQMPLGGILVVYDGQVRWSLLQIQEPKSFQQSHLDQIADLQLPGPQPCSWHTMQERWLEA